MTYNGQPGEPQTEADGETGEAKVFVEWVRGIRFWL
jgi:hypothetical protein